MARPVRCVASCGGGFRVISTTLAALLIRDRRLACRPGLVAQQAVGALGHEAFLPAPDRRLRRAGRGHDRVRADAVRARGHFPSDEAATKLLFLVLNRSEKEWTMPPRAWSMAKGQVPVIFGERFIKAMA
jgi:hypothetical protein